MNTHEIPFFDSIPELGTLLDSTISSIWRASRWWSYKNPILRDGNGVIVPVFFDRSTPIGVAVRRDWLARVAPQVLAYPKIGDPKDGLSEALFAPILIPHGAAR